MDNLEEKFLGKLFQQPHEIEKVSHLLESYMFEDELCGAVFLEMQKCYDNGKVVDSTYLSNKLIVSYGESRVLNLFKNCIQHNYFVEFVDIVSVANTIISNYKAAQINRLINSIRVMGGNVNEQIAFLQEQLQIIQGEKQTESKTLADITKEYKGSYFKEREVEPLNIGFQTLDDMLGGLEGGDIIVIGARPAVGKSALVTQITTNLAKQGKKVGFYNLEMADKQMYERFLVAESGIKLTRLRKAIRFLGDEEEKFNKANEVLEAQENIVLTTGSKSPSEIRAESRHMGYDIIIIDYLQLLRCDSNYKGNRVAEVGAISKAIKSLAMELKIPIVVLSQLNRMSEAKETKEPSMSELRESGDIEQDASVIMLLWNLDDDRIIKGCKIEKNRQGECGRVNLRFDGERMRFTETTESRGFKKIEDDCPFK